MGRLALAVMLLLAAVACGSPAEDSATPARADSSPQLLAPAEFATAIADPERVTVNVHVPFEGELPHTDLSIPFDRIKQQHMRMPADRSVPIAVYCMSGSMSAEAARILTSLGYTDVIDLDGGMEAWQASGRSVLR